MDDLFKGSLNQMGNLGKGLSKAVSDEGKKIAKTAAQQIGIERVAEDKERKENGEGGSSQKQEILQDQNTKEFIQQMYGASDIKKDSSLGAENAEQMVKKVKENPQKTPEDLKKEQELEQKLHQAYFQTLTQPQKRPETEERKEELKEEQETAQQRMERLQQEDLQKKKEEEEKKKPVSPLLKSQTTKAEALRGVSG